MSSISIYTRYHQKTGTKYLLPWKEYQTETSIYITRKLLSDKISEIGLVRDINSSTYAWIFRNFTLGFKEGGDVKLLQQTLETQDINLLKQMMDNALLYDGFIFISEEQAEKLNVLI